MHPPPTLNKRTCTRRCKTIEVLHYYSCVLQSVSCVCLCFCTNKSRNMKFEKMVVYENSSDKFDIGHCLMPRSRLL